MLSWLLQKHDVEVGVGLVARTVCHHVVLCLKVGRQQGVAAPADEFGNPSNTGSSRAVRWPDGGLWHLLLEGTHGCTLLVEELLVVWKREEIGQGNQFEGDV